MEIKYYRALKNIDRLTGVTKHKNYNLLEHSYMVAILFKKFASIEDVPYTMVEFDLVMNHDIVESVTGDLSYEVKKATHKTEISWEIIEDEIIKIHPQLDHYSDKRIKSGLNERQYNLFKTCDTLDLWIFLKEEVALGNTTSRVMQIIGNCERLIAKYGSEFKTITNLMQNYEV